jgi:hypothetical protein
MKLTHLSWIVIVVIMVGLVACNSMGGLKVTMQPEMPTVAPTLAPSEEAVQDAPLSTETVAVTATQRSEQVIEGICTKTSFGSTNTTCQVEQTCSLRLRGDGSAELTTTGPSITDHINCTVSSDETWYINGIASTTDPSVSFETCNFGNFYATGAVNFKDGLLGQATCTNKDGILFITLDIGK